MSNKNTKLVLNRQTDLILDNAKITAPVGIEKTDLPGLVDDLKSLNETDEKLFEAIKEKSADLTDAIATETARAEAAESEIGSKLESEAAARIADIAKTNDAIKKGDAKLSEALNAKVNAINESIATEVADRTAADAKLQSNIDSLQNELTADVETLQSNIDNEQARAEAAESKLTSDLADEVAARIDAVSSEERRAMAAEAGLSSDLAAEITRAEAAEGVLQSNIDVEKGRIDAILDASDADKDNFAEIVSLINSVDTTNDEAFAGYVLSNDAALAAEIARAEGAEADLASDLSAEAARAIAAEGVLTSDLASEVARAEAAEGAIDSKLDSEITNRTAADTAFTNSLNNEIADRVAGDQGLQAGLDSEISRATAAELKLTSDLAQEVADRTADVDAEEARAMAAESKLTSDLSAEVAARIAADDYEKVRAMATESALASDLARLTSDLTEESERAINAEGVLQSNIDVEKGRIDAILDGSDVNLDQFKEVVAFVESIDLENDSNLLGAVADINAAISTEEARAIAAEADLAADIAAEQARAQGQEAAIETRFINDEAALAAEIARAESAEDKIAADLSAEAARAKAAESAIDAAYKAADVAMDAAYKAADATLQSNINTEAAERLAADVTLQGNLDAETSRAQSAEASLSSDLAKETADRISAVSSEEVRAKAAESKLTSDLADEAARAKAAEGKLTSDLAAEVLRAETAEGVLTSDLASEVSRATAAEAGLASDLSDESARAIAAEAGLKSDIDTEKGRIDSILLASDADKDSFAEIVSLINSVDTTNDEAFAGYVLSNNAALAAEEDARKLADSNLSSDLSDEKSRAMSAEADLASDLADEKSRAMAAEAGLASDLSDEAARAIAAEGVLTADLTSEVNRATAAEGVLTADLASEVARAEAAEAGLASDLAAEVANREAGDTALQSSLDNETSDRLAADQALQANLDAETTRATGAEAILAKDLAEEVKERIDAVSSEESRAMVAEAELTKSLSAEAANRIKGDAKVQAALDAKVNAINESIATEVADRTADVDAEEARAMAAEAMLTKALAKSNAERISADEELTKSLDKEVTDRTDADTKLQEQIDTILDGSTVDLDQFAEVVAFVQSIDMTNDDALLTAVTDINSSIDAEVTRAEEAEAGIITMVGYNDMNDYTKGLWDNYSNDVDNAPTLSVEFATAENTSNEFAQFGWDLYNSGVEYPITGVTFTASTSATTGTMMFNTPEELENWAIGQNNDARYYSRQRTKYELVIGEKNLSNFDGWLEYMDRARLDEVADKVFSVLKDTQIRLEEEIQNESIKRDEADAKIIDAVGFDKKGDFASNLWNAYTSLVDLYDSNIGIIENGISLALSTISEVNNIISSESYPSVVTTPYGDITIEDNQSANAVLTNLNDVLDNAFYPQKEQLETITPFLPANIVNFEAWVDNTQDISTKEEFDKINNIIGFDDMGAIASADYKAYVEEVGSAVKMAHALASKLEAQANYLTSLQNAMSIGEFPVTVEGSEYVDATSLQIDIDAISLDISNIGDEIVRFEGISNDFAPINIVNFEAWVDFKKNVDNAENFKKVYYLIDKEVERAIEAEKGLDSKITDIISNTDITSIDSFSEVVDGIDSAVAIVNDNAAMYVVDNRPTMLEFDETPDGSGTTFNAPVIAGTHIVFLNGLMQFEGRDYFVSGGAVVGAQPTGAQPKRTQKYGAQGPVAAGEQSLSIEFYAAPEATDVLNVYGVQTGTEMNSAMSLADIVAAEKKGDTPA